MLKVLNGHAGIGGNRQLWQDVEVTAVESDPLIASIYARRFNQDVVEVCDVRKYLLKYYQEFDFIWLSPPCQRNSKARFLASSGGDYPPVYPDMSLYEYVLFLKHYYKGKWVVEHVKPFFGELIPAQIVSKHCFWANFDIPSIKLSNRYHFNTIEELEKDKGIDLSSYDFKGRNKLQVIRNAVHPKLGKHILECALKRKQRKLTEVRSADSSR